MLNECFNGDSQMNRQVTLVRHSSPVNGLGTGIIEWLDQACQRFPEQIALEYKGCQVSYSNLDEMANRLANCLMAQLSKGSIVAVILDDRIEIIVTLIGILRTGCVFVPLDPDFPASRLSQIVADVEPDCFITNSKYEDLVNKINSANNNNYKIINLGENSKYAFSNEGQIKSSKFLVDFSAERPIVDLDPNDLCYIYYTSGSTGTPKGIAGKLKGISHFIKWEIETFNIDYGWRVSQFTQPTFDALLRDVFVPLCVGGTICIPPEKPLMMGTTELVDWIDTQKINLIHCVPTVFGAIASSHLHQKKFQSLKYILMAGETLPISDVNRWMEVYESRIKLVNLYGASETTMVKFYHQIQKSDLERGFIPIGKPMKGARAVVLDEWGNVCPRGVFGELYIRTPYQTLGYYKNPNLTKKVFVNNPFSEDPNDLLYKTGDLARLLNDGTFQLRGRKDNQVKIRGIRVELTEIENQLRDHPLVRNAVVEVREDIPGYKRLVAYLVADPSQAQELSLVDLRSFLKKKLPDYMMPSHFVMLEALPLTPNGKVNRRALPTPDISRSHQEASFVAPRNKAEEMLAAIWAEVLGRERLGIHDNFFELGGHSLLSIRLMAQIQKQFGKNLPLATLFQNPTIEHLASLLGEQTDFQTSSPLVAIQPSGAQPPFFCVHPIGGNVLCYADLARHLGIEQPFYGLQSPGLNGEREPHTRIEDMASHYIEALQTIQPQGPYRIGGWSLGGIIAFEMAQQLHSCGHQVALLALIDSYAPITSNKREEMDEAMVVATLAMDIGGLFGKELSVCVDELKQMESNEQLNYILEQAKTLNILPPEVEVQQMRYYVQVFKANLQAKSCYTPQPYRGKITLLCASEKLKKQTYDPSQGWSRLTEVGVEIRQIPGDHYTILQEPHVQILADRLKNFLIAPLH
ncbi:amino acid adenylation domain-containing protein [Iningainema tapete]|uniref:Amino acid adenylation domain-containing protein n=1 Tax=Iningainema tapete BLCC-T55 TaxID=2748662 RepID=A0A8J6XDA8_9CYAN|nr:amino acid adenylation domain-containing protein [Iningainema tapete]MBD2773825.1 amino acid adenylation domain-containing protein [Iningainema tapete BLCC-T55]